MSVLLFEDLGLMLDTVSSATSAMAGRLRPRTAVVAAGDSCLVSVLAGADAVERAACDWRQLESYGAAATPFQSLAVARAAAEAHHRRGDIPRVIVVRQGEHPVVILPTVLTRQFGFRVARFLGDPLIQYGDALCEAGTPKRHIETALRAASDGVDAINFRKVRDDARIAPVLRAAATPSNRDEAPFLDLTHAAATGEEPRQLRRARRKLSSCGALRLEVTHGTAAHSHLRDALMLKRRWLQARRLPSGVIGNEHWEQALERLVGHDGRTRLHVAVLYAGERPAGYEVAFTAGDHWYAFLGAIADDFARHSPGRVQVADTIAWCRANGFRRYDLLAPADDVKRSYCNAAAAVADYACASRPGGHLLTLALRASPAAKALYVRLPAPLRRLALAVAGR
ncbi:MAG: GNAT family N-acetyltransferase [Pseudolabrys sp.]|nr:GNAT family N-acetyltransferase [Pseudolabrys sp.]